LEQVLKPSCPAEAFPTFMTLHYCHNSVAQCGRLWLYFPLGMAMKRERVTILYSGRVQGVGFRYAVKILTTGFEVTGIVRNLPDGRVEVAAEAAKEELEAFLQAIRDSDVGRFIRQEQANWSEAKNDYRGFEITQ
jgi:acylphosphatase